jgi:predicted RNase H-like nuclease (RuvC/YqgF family)
MDIHNIIKFIEDLNNQNNELKNKIISIEKENKELKDNLSNLTKVSFIGSIDKQLKEKQLQYEILEKKLVKANKLIENFNLEQHKTEENKLEETNGTEPVIEDRQIHYETIQYKKKEYLLDPDTNKIYNIDDNVHIANLVNNKLRFLYKKNYNK